MILHYGYLVILKIMLYHSCTDMRWQTHRQHTHVHAHTHTYIHTCTYNNIETDESSQIISYLVTYIYVSCSKVTKYFVD